MSRTGGLLLFGLTALTVTALDQASKWFVISTLELGQSYPAADTVVGRFFSFTRVHNTGFAFGLFQGNSELLAVVSVVVVGALLLYRHRLPVHAWWLQLALGLQVGGALGNLIDRLRLGHVTDFLDFKVWPVFNMSDMSIFLGVLILAWHLWSEERLEATAATGAAAPGPLDHSAVETGQAVEAISASPAGTTGDANGGP